MEAKNSGSAGNKKVTFEFKAGPIFELTIPASLVSVFSGAVAYAQAPKPEMDAMDSVSLGILVAIGTYLGAKAGKKTGEFIGAVTGGLVGWLAGAVFGSALGRFGSEKDEKIETAAAMRGIGGLFGGLAGAVVLTAVGYAAGFMGGTYAGHVLTRDASMKYIFNKPAAAAPTQGINLPKQDMPAVVTAFKP